MEYSVVAKFIEAGDVKVFMLIKESIMNVSSILNCSHLRQNSKLIELFLFFFSSFYF